MLANLEGGNHEKARSRFDASLPAPAATAAPNAYITNQGGGVSVGPDKTKVTDPTTNVVVTNGLIVRVGSKRVARVRLT